MSIAYRVAALAIPSERGAISMSRLIQMTVVVAICVLSAGLSGGSFAQGDEKQPGGQEQPMSYWMKRKLEYSQNILSGIAKSDFEAIESNAQSMRNLSKIEGFIRRQAPGYATQLHVFEESNDEIIRQARKHNVEGTALAFTQLTISCVNCHKHLREAK